MSKIESLFQNTVFPVVHLNGSGAVNLKDSLLKIVNQLHDAYSALARNSPHARDYYVLGDDAFQKARRQHEQNLHILCCMIEQYEQIWQDVDRQDQDRKVRW